MLQFPLWPDSFLKSHQLFFEGRRKTKVLNWIINNLGKDFEKYFKKRLTNYLTKYNILCNNQFGGFRISISTTSALYELTKEIITNIGEDEKKYCCIPWLS